jgi:hypothetical protein
VRAENGLLLNRRAKKEIENEEMAKPSSFKGLLQISSGICAEISKENDLRKFEKGYWQDFTGTM